MFALFRNGCVGASIFNGRGRAPFQWLGVQAMHLTPSQARADQLPGQRLIAGYGGVKAGQGGFVNVFPVPAVGGRFLDMSYVSCAACRRGASHGTGKARRAYQKGVIFGIRHAFSFVPVQPVTQQVIPLYLFMKALMEQLRLHLLRRHDAPSVVPPSRINQCKTYREAVKLCWELRRVDNMTQATIAEEARLYAPHVSGYLHDGKGQRDLPGWAIRGFEWACGNTAITQWHNVGARLTVVEEMQLLRGFT
jgi:hypothetical protein